MAFAAEMPVAASGEASNTAEHTTAQEAVDHNETDDATETYSQGAPGANDDAEGKRAESSDAEGASASDDGAQDAIDITDAWRSGELTLSEPGRYVVTGDVETDGTLFVAAPDGESIELDLRGHTIKVAGDVESGIDVGMSLGDVVIDGADGQKSARLITEAHGAQSAAAAMLALYRAQDNHGAGLAAPKITVSDVVASVQLETAAEGSQARPFDAFAIYVGYADDEDARSPIKADFNRIAVESSISEPAFANDNPVISGERAISPEEIGVAYGVYCDAAEASIDGAFSSHTQCTNLTSDLYGTEKSRFAFGSSFFPNGELRTYVAGNEPGVPIATAEAQVGNLTWAPTLLIDATGNGRVCAFSDGTLYYLPEDAVTEAGDDPADPDEPEGNSEQGSAADENHVSTGEKAIDSPQGQDEGETPEGDDEEAAGAETLQSDDDARAGGGVSERQVNDIAAQEATDLVASSLTAANVNATLKVASLMTAEAEGDSIDLATLWDVYYTNASKKPTTAMPLDPSKTYYLSADLIIPLGFNMSSDKIAWSDDLSTLTTSTSKQTAVPDGVDPTTTIDLRGHTLTIGATGEISQGNPSTQGITINRTAPVIIKGGSLTLLNTVGSIDFKKGSLSVDHMSIIKGFGDQAVADGGKKVNEDGTETLINAAPAGLQNASSSAVLKSSSANVVSLSVENSSITLDWSTINKELSAASNVLATNGNAVAVSLGGFKSATSGTSVSFNNCSFDARGPRSTNSNTPGDAIDATCVYITNSNTGEIPVSFTDCSFTASSALGDANCVWQNQTVNTDANKGKALRVTLAGSTTLSASAGDGATASGLRSPGYGLIVADGALTFSSASSGQAAVLSGLAAKNADDAPFRLGTAFSGSGLSALVGENSDGVVIASYDADAGTDTGEFSGVFVNAHDNPAIKVVAADGAIRFAVDEEKAVARIDSAGGSQSYFGTVPGAVSAAKSGDTVVLLKGTPSIALVPTDEEEAADDHGSRNYALDLNGQTVNSLTCSSAESWTVKDSASGSTTTLKGASFTEGNTTYAAAVRMTGSGTLALEGLRLSIDNRQTISTAVRATAGAVVLDGCSVQAKSRSARVYGAWVKDADLTLKRCAMSVTQYSGNPAYGVLADGGSCKMEGGSIAVEGIGDELYGIRTTGSLDAEPADDSNPSIAVTAEDEADAFGIYAAEEASINLKSATLAVRADEAVETAGHDFWCIWTANSSRRVEDENHNTTTVELNASISLAGTVSFESANSTHIRHRTAPITLASDFALANEDATVTVRSDKLGADNSFARFADDAAAPENFNTNMFSAMEGSDYEGWTVAKTQDGKALAWVTDAAAAIGDVRYGSLTSALAAAQDGETVLVLRDSASAPLSVSKAVTIDLAGHDVRVSSAGGNAVPCVTCTVDEGAFTVKDSGSSDGSVRGKLVLAGATGILMRGAGTVRLDGCNVYATGRGVSLAGYNDKGKNGAVELAGANLTVAECEASLPLIGSTPMLPSVTTGGAVGIEITAPMVTNWHSGAFDYQTAGKGSVTVDEDSRIAVVNNGTYSTENVQLTDDVRSGSGIGSANTVKRVYLDETSDLYADIAQQFRAVARYDGGTTASSGETVHNANIYYATSISSGGNVYMAFSGEVTGEDIGKAEKIKPEAIYMVESYQSAPDAVGVTASGARDGSGATDVCIRGTVSATSTLGNAYGLRPNAYGTWQVDGGSVGATSRGVSTYRKATGEVPDLKGALGLSVAKMGFYPQGHEPTEVIDAFPEAAGIAVAGGEPAVSLGGNVAISADAASGTSYDIGADIITVETGFALGEASDSPLTVKAKEGYAQAGKPFAQAGEGTVFNVALSELFADAAGELSSAVDLKDNRLVWAGESYSVSFVDQRGYELKREDNVLNGQTVVPPPANELNKDPDAEYTYEFIGWSTNENAKRGDVGLVDSSVTSFPFEAVAGQTETVYHAIFEAVPKSVSLTFRLAYDSQGRLIATYKTQVPAGAKLGSLITETDPSKKLDIPDAKSYSEQDGSMRHAFVGWAAGNTVYDPLSMGDLSFTADTVFTAYYADAAEGQHIATFKAGTAVSAYAFDDGTAPSWTEASGKPGLPTTNRAPDGHTYVFAGWHKGWDSGDNATVDAAAGTALPQASSDVYYTASFTDTLNKVAVSLHYDVPGNNGTWYKKTNQLSVDYGKSPLSALKDEVVSYTWNGKLHEFVGWSTRESDKDPLYGPDELPAATSSGFMGGNSWWAIYKVSDLTADVTFIAGGQEIATAKGQTITTTIDEAFAATGADLPTPPAGKKFDRWAQAEDGSEPLAGIATIGDAKGADTGNVKLYPHFVDEEALEVTFWFQNGKSPESETLAVRRGTMIEFGAGYKNPVKDGYAFYGWNADAGGTGPMVYPESTTVTENMDLYAQYKEIAPVQAEGTTIDVSGAHINDESAVGASSVIAELNPTTRADATLASAIAVGEEAGQAYSFDIAFRKGGLTTFVTEGFGTATLSIPVPADWAGHAVKAYWLKADGSFEWKTIVQESGSDASTQAASDGEGTATLALSEYAISPTGGNILLAKVPTNLERNQANAVSALEAELASYREADYEDFEGTVHAAYTKAIGDVKAATTAQGAADAANAGISAMRAVESTRDLAASKAEALQRLAEAYSGYEKSDYANGNWQTLAAAYSDAKKGVNAAKTTGEAGGAANAGILAMAAVPSGTKPAGDSGTGASSGGNSATGSDAGGAGGTGDSGGTGTGNSGAATGSGLSSNSGTTGSQATSASGLRSTATGSGLSSSATGSGLGSTGSGLSASSAGGPASSAGAASRLGATLQPVDAGMVSEYSLQATKGLFVSAVSEGGPADSAGIANGDVITAVDGADVASLDDLQAALDGKKAGDKVVLTVNRDGEVKDYEVVLGEEMASNAASILGIDNLGTTGNGVDGGLANGDDGGLETTGDQAQEGLARWAAGHIVPIILVALLLIAAVSALVWWLLRRRNESMTGDEDFENDAVPPLPGAAIQL